jgi:hypothetical protein
VTGGQRISDRESHFAHQVKVEDCAVHVRIRNYAERGIHGRHRPDDLASLGCNLESEILCYRTFVFDDQYAPARELIFHFGRRSCPASGNINNEAPRPQGVKQTLSEDEPSVASAWYAS